jgi:UDP-galactopyranose mutase
VEYKHFLHQKSDWTILSKEITCDSGEPYYPVPTQENRDLYEKYNKLATKESDVHFIGRLASYKYFNMDQAIRNAIDYYKEILMSA